MSIGEALRGRRPRKGSPQALKISVAFMALKIPLASINSLEINLSLQSATTCNLGVRTAREILDRQTGC